MKIKLLKEVQILNYKFKMVYNRKESGGYFNFSTREIGIGLKHLKNNPEHVFMMLSHEIMEVVTVATNTRYEDTSVHGDWKFFMNHKEFENNMQIFSQVIFKFIG